MFVKFTEKRVKNFLINLFWRKTWFKHKTQYTRCNPLYNRLYVGCIFIYSAGGCRKSET